MPITDERFTTVDERYDRYRTAYLEMAARARYRPAAPSDGFGSIELDDNELYDPVRLQREAHQFARTFLKYDDEMEYRIGCPDFTYNRAFCYLVEAAKALCSPRPKLALDLMTMARKEIIAERRVDRRTE